VNVARTAPTNAPALKVEGLTINLDDIGAEWAFGAWDAGDADWCLAAYDFAQAQ
jgi:hypothetical protein